MSNPFRRKKQLIFISRDSGLSQKELQRLANSAKLDTTLVSIDGEPSRLILQVEAI